jgi:hypothetical protein
VDSSGRIIWIADAHRGDGKRYVVRADERLTAFVELESAIRGPQVRLLGFVSTQFESAAEDRRKSGTACQAMPDIFSLTSGRKFFQTASK